MATGDMKNNLKKLQSASKAVKFSQDLDIDSMAKGSASPYLPLLHHALLEYSSQVAEKLAALEIDLYGKSDAKFMDGLYKVCRDVFSYKPPITKEQFFSTGFAEKKAIMACEVLNQITNLHKELTMGRHSKGNTSSNTSALSTSQSVPKVGARTPSAPLKTTSLQVHKETRETRGRKASALTSATAATRARTLPEVEPSVEKHFAGAETKVEVVNMSKSLGVKTQPRRPIDMVPVTPGISKDQLEQLEGSGGLAQLCKILNELTDRMYNIDKRLQSQEQRLAELTKLVCQEPQQGGESSLHAPANGVQGGAATEQGGGEGDATSGFKLSSMFARLELLENSVTMLRHQTTAPSLTNNNHAIVEKPLDNISGSTNGLLKQGSEKPTEGNGIEDLASPIIGEVEGEKFNNLAASTPKTENTVQKEQLLHIQEMISDTTSMLALERDYPRHSEDDYMPEPTI